MTLEEEWAQAAADLGLDIVAPFRVSLPGETVVHARVLLRNFGASNGMLVLTNYDEVENVLDPLVRAGYGFSVLSDPGLGATYSREVIIEVLRDWGWAGPADAQPRWL